MIHAAVRADPGAILDVMVEGPDGERLADADLRRLFPGSALTGVRLNRLRNWPRLVVRLDGVPVALATYTLVDRTVHVPDFALDVPAPSIPDAPGLRRRALYALIDGIELSAAAAACRRVVLIPPREVVSVVEHRGYTIINEGCAGSWMEKSIE